MSGSWDLVLNSSWVTLQKESRLKEWTPSSPFFPFLPPSIPPHFRVSGKNTERRDRQREHRPLQALCEGLKNCKWQKMKSEYCEQQSEGADKSNFLSQAPEPSGSFTSLSLLPSVLPLNWRGLSSLWNHVRVFICHWRRWSHVVARGNEQLFTAPPHTHKGR